MGGHRYHEALGFLDEARRRDWDVTLLMNVAAEPSLSAALGGRAVLHDPVFRQDLTFDERTRAFADLLHEHLDADTSPGDRVLVTVATQCEARALAAWLGELPVGRRPWAVALFLSDRWNRAPAAVGAWDAALAGPASRARQLAELAVLGGDLARLPAAVARRLILGASTHDLGAELSALLGVPVQGAPMGTFVDAALPSRDGLPPGLPPSVAVVGGARPEKGSHHLPAIIAAARRLCAVDFRIQLANEQLPPEGFAALAAALRAGAVELLEGPADRNAYFAFLAGADLLLLPYERSAYRQRLSGVLAEAALIGMPAVVPSGTWMAQQLESGEIAGVVYTGDGAEAVAGAIQTAVANLPALAARAVGQMAAWRQTHTTASFLDWIESEISARTPRL